MVQLSTTDERADLAAQLLEEGWQAIKLRLHYQTLKEDVELVAKVRQAVGAKIGRLAVPHYSLFPDLNPTHCFGNIQGNLRRDVDDAVAVGQE